MRAPVPLPAAGLVAAIALAVGVIAAAIVPTISNPADLGQESAGSSADPGRGPATASPDPHPSPTPSGLKTYYIAPDGDDDASGSRADPWRTAIRASRSLRPGDTLLARGGRYVAQGGYGWSASGTPDAPITFAAAAGEAPIFDGDGREQWLILRDVHDLVIEDLEITNYRPVRNGVLLVLGASHDIVLDRIVMRGNASGDDPSQRLAHLIYPGAGPVTNLTIRNSTLDATGMGGAAIHVFHDPGPVNLLIENNDLRNGYWGVIVASNANGVTIRGNRFEGNTHDVVVWDEARDVQVHD